MSPLTVNLAMCFFFFVAAVNALKSCYLFIST